MRYVTLLALAACSASDVDIDGPIRGQASFYTVASIALPAGATQAASIGDDLDGNGSADDQLGAILGTLASQDDLTSHGADMIGAGAIASTFEIEADDLVDSTNAGVWYYGATGAAAQVAEGAFRGGVFASNRTRTTRIPGSASVVLPIFDRADPSTVELHEMEIDMQPDGSGGYTAIVRGGFAPADASAATAAGVVQMLEDDPADHVDFAGTLDVNHDGVVTAREVAMSALVEALLDPDIELDGVPYISAAFVVHLVPCTGAGCVPPPADPCFDRVRDGDETDVDCGGATCAARCAGNLACATGADCQSGTCDAGTCAPPTCNDGKQDGYELGVDCGGLCPTAC